MDFIKELDNYEFIKIDKELTNSQDEVKLLLDTFNYNIKRMSKEQNKSNMALEEMLELIENNNELHKNIEELQLRAKQIATQNKTLQKVITGVLDKVEDVYRFAHSSQNDVLGKEILAVWESIKENIAVANIIVIDKADIPYNFDIHTIQETISKKDYPEGSVVEILKCGYIYGDGEISKAKVIVNSTLFRSL